MKNFLKIIISAGICLSLSGTSIIAQDTGEKEKLNEFLNAETQEARNLLSSYSYEFLEKFSSGHMESLKKDEARKLWIVEEYYKRKADKAAADRLFYVFLAVGLLMILIFLLVFRIYQLQKNLEKMD